MGVADVGKFVSTIAKGTVALGDNNKKLQKAALEYKVIRKLLGPIVDLFIDLKQTLVLFNEIFGESTEQTEEFGEAVEDATGPFQIFFDILAGIRMALVFLISLFIGVSAALVFFTGSIAGATGAFPEFYDGFNSMKDSIVEVIGHLQTIGAVIMGADWSPILGAATLAIGGIIMLIVSFWDAGLSAIAEIWGSIALLFTYMETSGAFQSMIDGVGGIMLAFVMAFDYIFQILDAFGINWTNIFGVVTTIFGGLVGFLINSGLLAFFGDLIGVIGLILPPVVFVVGEILVLIALFIAMLVGPLFTTAFNIGKLILNLVTGTIAIVVAVFRTGFAIMSAAIEFWIAVFTGNWSAIPEIFDGLVEKLVGIWTTLWTSLSGIMDNIYDSIVGAISGAIDFVMGPIDELLGKIDDVTDVSGMVGDAAGFVGGLFSGNLGGIATGPESGYAAELHGTEAVVPLPDGRSIPVALQGGGGGGDNVTVNISVSGGGNAREIAKEVSREVQRVFRTRSRGGGYGRGVT